MNKHPIIAREGWPFFGLSVLVGVFTQMVAGFLWAFPVWVVSLFILQFFRDPARTAPLQPNAVLSPADGRVICVEKTKDPYLEREALKISVFMNVFNVHSNWVPVDAVVQQAWYYPGRFFNASLDKASLDNERNALWLRTPEGSDIVVVQVAGLIARRILCYVEPGGKVARGQRYGFIRFGSRVDIYMPLLARPLVQIGDKVLAVRSILADLEGL